MQTTKSKLRFESFGYYCIGLLLLVFLGFWPSYFSQFFTGTAHLSNYFHFHATVALLWIAVLIVQPVLIRKKKLQLHRRIGRATYVLFPLLCLSVLLLAHSRHSLDEKDLALRLFTPFRDVFILIVAYWIGIRYKHVYHIHARAMIATGFVFILPALSRFVAHTGVGFAMFLFLLFGVFYSLLIGLIIAERNQKQGRWVFPLIMGLFMVSHIIIFSGVHIPQWEAFCRWFITLPLT